MELSSDVTAALERVVAVMASARHDWWVIASAACAIHGIDAGPVRDVDVLLDERDFAAVMARIGQVPQPGEGNDLFRSRWFNTWTEPALPVEFFAGFELYENGDWTAVRPVSREFLAIAGLSLPVPSQTELAEILERFGRPKDLVRARLLNPSGPFPSR